MKKLLAAATLLVLAGQASAHDLWLEREGEGFGLYYGHKHSGHAGVKLMKYEPEWVREALCFDAAGRKLAFQSAQSFRSPQSPPTYPYRIPRECAAACVLTSSGYWTKTPYGTENRPKADVRMPIKSWLSVESVKRIDRWSAELAEPLTAWLEMTPLVDPGSLREGKKLRLSVSFDGRPVEGVVVSYDGKPRGTTGSDGRINIRVRHGGFQVIQASLTLPDASGKADEVIHAANLNFELPEE
jgi:nickel transport protein